MKIFHDLVDSALLSVLVAIALAAVLFTTDKRWAHYLGWGTLLLDGVALWLVSTTHQNDPDSESGFYLGLVLIAISSMGIGYYYYQS